MAEKQLPEGWGMVKFGEMAKHISKRVEPSETDLDVYVGLEHLDKGSLKIKRRGVPSDVKGQKLLVKPGQIIFGKRRAYQKKVAVADFDGICSAHAMVLEAAENLESDYLAYFMETDVFMNEAIRISEGSLSPTIKWKTLADRPFPLPPKERQNEIVKSLKSFHSALEKNREAIYEGLHLRRRIANAIYKDARTIGSLITLRQACSIFSDGDWIESKDQSTEGIRLLQTGNVGIGEYIDKTENSKFISQETFRRLNCHEVEPGDLLFSRLPDPIARACIIPDLGSKMITAVDCTIARANKSITSERYLLYFTLTSDYEQQVGKYFSGSTRTRISRKNLEDIKVPLVPLDVQEQYLQRLEALSTLIGHLKNKEDQLLVLKNTYALRIFKDI